MAKQQTLRITVPDDAEHPVRLIRDALERYCGQVYPIAVAPVDDDYYPVGTYILIEKLEA